MRFDEGQRCKTPTGQPGTYGVLMQHELCNVTDCYITVEGETSIVGCWKYHHVDFPILMLEPEMGCG